MPENVRKILCVMSDLFFSVKINDAAKRLGMSVEFVKDKAVALDAWGSPLRLNAPWWFWNLFGEQAVFLLSRKGQ